MVHPHNLQHPYYEPLLWFDLLLISLLSHIERYRADMSMAYNILHENVRLYPPMFIYYCFTTPYIH